MAESNLLEESNPGLGTIKSMDILKGKVEKAKDKPASGQEPCNKGLQQRKGNNIGGMVLLTFEQLNNTETFDLAALKPRYGIGGADLSSTMGPSRRHRHIYGA